MPMLRKERRGADSDDFGEGEVCFADTDRDLVGLPRGHRAAGAVGPGSPGSVATPAVSHRSIVSRWSLAPVSRMRRVGRR